MDKKWGMLMKISDQFQVQNTNRKTEKLRELIT